MKINRTFLVLLFQIQGWGVFTLGNLLFNYLVNKQVTPSDVYFSVVIFILGILLTYFMRFVFQLYEWHRENLAKIIPKLALLSLLLGLLHISLVYLLSTFWGSGLLDNFSRANFFAQVGTFTSVYIFWGLLYTAIFFFRNFKQKEIQTLRQEAQIKEIQLNKFKSQLNPHFLFNSMNGLRSLIDEDTEKAKTGITQLSNILRHTLTLEKKSLIELNDELKLVKDYLNLEKIRLEERLEFEVTSAEEVQKFQLPPMIIQTLAENAIKHGIGKLVKGGHIYIKCTGEGGFLKITIVNSGQFSPNCAQSLEEASGFGIENSRQRLHIIFGKLAQLTIKNLNNKEVITTLKIPRK